MKHYLFRRVMILLCLHILVSASCAVYTTSFKGLTEEDEKYLEKAKKFPTEFHIPKSEEYDAWGRSHSFIGKYGSMKVQVVTDFIIETYNPSEDRYAYRIVKTPIGDSLEISVICIAGEMASRQIADEYSHICAYYIKTGLLPSSGLIMVTTERPGLPLWSIFLGLGLISVVVYIAIHSSVY